MAKKVKIYIGTSGWSYHHWSGIFYPQDLSPHKWLEYYTQHFKTVELNASFYHLPRATTFTNWRKNTPDGFLFAVKASRFITHIKKLKGTKEPWQNFISRAKNLKEKLGPILFQLPPSLKGDPRRLESFLKILAPHYQYVLEARHRSWFNQDIYKVLKKFKVALCLADSPCYPFQEIITSNFVYIRFHGGKILYGSNYSEKELKEWAKKIKKWLKKNLEIYAYFNNDTQGFAVKNAKTLIKLVNYH